MNKIKNDKSGTIRDRIREFRRVFARELMPNEKNWRKHPGRQREALRGILGEIGYAGALLAREREDGTLELIDGHLRLETTPDQMVPVLILDLDEKEAEALLAFYDPISALAEKDDEAFSRLVADVTLSDANLRDFLDELARESPCSLHEEIDRTKEVVLPQNIFQILLSCRDEAQQRELYEEFLNRNLKPRLLNM